MPDNSTRGWCFWIDVGGTFTDCLARDPDGKEHQIKVLSSGVTKCRFDGPLAADTFVSTERKGDGEDFWQGTLARFIASDGRPIHQSHVVHFDSREGRFQIEEPLQDDALCNTVSIDLDPGIPAPVVAIRRLLGIGIGRSLPEVRVHLGTTRGTNALLTRSGAKTAFVTTVGFADLLRIGDQARPHLFQLSIQKRQSLFETCVEVEERIHADGTVERSPDPNLVKQQLVQLKEDGIESVAICLMHGYRFPDHEQLIGEIAREVGFSDVRLSHQVAPLIKILNRGETTVLDAYLNPVIANYLDQIQEQFGDKSTLRLMTSFGGLVGRKRFSGKDGVLSGPAGGVVGAARVAQSVGFDRALTFDMGGTSTDVGRFDGQLELEYETEKADVRIVSPMMAIETVAAGGGSICKFDGAKLTVGPESATSDPGPACYGNGGPLTVTDVNLFLGRIVTEKFPFELDREAVDRRLQEICHEMRGAGIDWSTAEVAMGFLKIANNNMAAAIRCVSIAKGYDPKQYALVSFGGAGSQHCCAVADALEIPTIVDHPRGSILSAVGIRLADQAANAVRPVVEPLTRDSEARCEKLFAEMRREIVDAIKLENGNPDSIEFQFSLDLRYEGTDACENIEQSDDGFSRRFSEVHQRRYGYKQDRPIEIVAARAVGTIAGSRLATTDQPPKTRMASSEQSQVMQIESVGSEQMRTQTVPIFERQLLQNGDQIIGPAMVVSPLTSTIIDKGWKSTTLADGQLILERQRANPIELNLSNDESNETPDPVQLEIFNNHFSTIARQMGISLQNTSVSVNVKERLDFSCAIFTGEGELVVNAPHIPVHLGAMSHSVRAVIADNPQVKPGDVWVTNDPYRGGSHLPDVTVVSPVFVDGISEPKFWVASRGHHAEIGGIAPGSMPANAKTLAEEGVLIQNFKLIDSGVGRFEAFRNLLTQDQWPSRNPDENIADVNAQVAANRSGEHDLQQLVNENGIAKVLAYMKHIQFAAETKTRNALKALPNERREFEDQMDNGRKIRIAITKTDDRISFDFCGTDPVSPDNLNANPAIVSAAVMYVMRCLIEEDIPLNEGVMEPVEIVLPECFLNPLPGKDAAASPAIVGGNVETSQRVVDVILGALGLAAASQGTMNNWLMGNENFGYYETVCGGSGATPMSAGVDAVHTHMTNTRLTDPEILESRYPVILRSFAIRQGSGGNGMHPGGNGIIREVQFCETLVLSLLTNRRRVQPFGLAGGSAGAPGENWLVRNGEDGGESSVMEPLDPQCEVNVAAGDRLVLKTPGGGGYGRPD